MQPYFQKILCDSETPVSLYAKLTRGQKYAFLLESAEPHQTSGRYSFIGFDPLFLHVFPAGGTQDPLKILQKTYEKIAYTPNAALPRLQAGFVGYFTYETARHFEKISLPTQDAEIPEGIFFFPKNLLMFDHFEHTLTLIAYTPDDLKKMTAAFQALRREPGPEQISLNSAHAPKPSVSATEKEAGFESKVSDAKEKICAGEAFQIVVSQLFSQKTNTPPFDLYRRLRLLSPSPYMYFLHYPDFEIIGSSPETLVQTSGDEVVVRPIAGTRRRGKNPDEDASLALELLHDEKEQAEHMMLVDLGRNDVSRIAKAGSVRVTRLMEVEKYSHVMHLVSEIRGKRTEGKTLFDVFKIAFPAGTLTGAPKIRAMEIIADLEKKPRGIYGGAVGYFDLSGSMDFAIAIRTMLYKNGEVQLRAGAGIVYDSKPEFENLECFNKARGPMSAVANL